MIDSPSLAKFTAFVQLKDFRGPTKTEYVRYVRRLGDHYHSDPATLTEDQVRAYYLELRQVRHFGASAMKVAQCALRAFYRDCLHVPGWTVFDELRIAPPQTLPLVLSREQVAQLLKAVQLPRYRTLLGLIYHTGLRVGEAVRLELRDLQDTHTGHPRLHVRCGKGGKDRFVPLSPVMVAELRTWWQTHRHPVFLFPGPSLAWRERSPAVNVPRLTAMLQTWTRDLRYHPHVHVLVPGGGLTPNGLRWGRVANAEFLFPQMKLAARFKGRLKEWLRTQAPELFQQVPQKVWWMKWVVDIQPVGGGEAALKYLAAYLCRPPLHEKQIERWDKTSVTFRYRENTGTPSSCTVSGEEFVRRFLQHVQPKGFQRVRHYGWRGAAAKTKWERILALLDWKCPALGPSAPTPAPRCPVCGKPMFLLGTLPRAPT
jgi:integrase